MPAVSTVPRVHEHVQHQKQRHQRVRQEPGEVDPVLQNHEETGDGKRSQKNKPGSGAEKGDHRVLPFVVGRTGPRYRSSRVGGNRQRPSSSVLLKSVWITPILPVANARAHAAM